MRRIPWIGAALLALCFFVYLLSPRSPREAGALRSASAAADVPVSQPAAGTVEEDIVASESVPGITDGRSVSEREVVRAGTPTEEASGGFLVEGVVLQGTELGIEEDARVQVLRVDREKRFQVAAADVGEDGRWEPLEVPLEPGRFLARFQSFQAIPVELDLGRPADGETVQVEFQVRKGGVLFFEVVDPAGEMLRKATITGTWLEADGTARSRTALVRPDGYYAMRGLPEAVIRVSVESEGFDRRQETLAVPELDPAIHVFHLDPAGGGIRGRCEQDGEPLADYDVVYWRSGRWMDFERIRLRDTDGSFEIDGLVPGTYEVIAYVMGSNHSPIERVVVPEQGYGEAVIRVPSPVSIYGRVVSAADGSPIEDASVAIAIAGRFVPNLEFGDVFTTAADGRFEGIPVTPGSSRLWVRAQGFGLLDIPVPGSGSSADMGDLRLQPAQACEIRLVAGTGIDLTRFLLWPRSAGMPWTRFSADGVLSFAVAPGRHVFHLRDLEAGTYVTRLRFPPGESWKREIRVDGGPRVNVAILRSDGGDEPLSPEAFIRVSRTLPGAETLTYVEYAIRSPFVLENQEPGQVRIEVRDGEQAEGSGVFEITSEPEQFFTIELGDRGTRLRLVDGKGEPVVAAEVLMADEVAGDFYRPVVTDTEGRTRLPGTRRRRAFLTIKHAVGGSRTAIPITLPEDPEEELLLVLEAHPRVRVHATRQGAPASGITVHLLTEAGLYFDVPRVTDGEGTVLWEDVPPGGYQVRVEQTGYWIDHSRFAVGDSDADVFLELRELGGLEVRVSNAEGLPVNGVRVDLRLLDLGVDLRALAQEGRLRLPDMGLVTGGHGRLELKHLPEGRYAWSVPLADGGALGGVVMVEGGELARAAIRLP